LEVSLVESFESFLFGDEADDDDATCDDFAFCDLFCCCLPFFGGIVLFYVFAWLCCFSKVVILLNNSIELFVSWLIAIE
jgi:hypothetical protein